jgi:parallel beta-helix repeat protein
VIQPRPSTPSRARRTGSLLFALLIAAAVSLPAELASASPAAPASSTDAGNATTVTFTDIASSPFRVDIEWVAQRGIARGCTSTRYCPKDPVTRGQMASFLARAFGLPSTSRDYFSDDNGTIHEGAINRVAAAGIAGGCAAGRFCPSADVTREQLASFLARALKLPAATHDYFWDVRGSIHEADVNRVAAAGITGGCGPGKYCPTQSVSREQIAAFLRRALVPSARVAPPPPLPDCSSSLQSIVDRATSGATVTAPACTYRETVTIKKPLTLKTVGGRVDGGGVRTHGFVVTASDVTIDGFEVTGTRNPAQDGAVRVRSAHRFTLRNAHIHHTGGSCVSIAGGSGHRVVDSELAYCAQQGYHLASVTDTVVARNRIHHNNPNRAYDPEWEAGGGKAARVLRLTFDSNRVYANRGPGLWCDIDCRDVTFKNNRVYQNESAGIFFEISDGALITGNRVWENGWRKREWGWGAGILISSSRNVEITRNIVAWNADGISVISQNRSGGYGWQPGVSTWNSVVNVNVHDNDIILAPQASDTSEKFTLAWLQDWNGVLFQSSSNNRGSGNRYWHAHPEPSTRFAWAGGRSRLADFNATPGESNGRYLSTTERNNILSAAGIPTAPQSR